MLISTKGRYALRVLLDLADHEKDGYTPLKEIAGRQEISEKYLEIIIKILVQNQIVVGLRGKGGGYRLKCSPEDISVGSVLRLTEDSFATVSCLSPDQEPCPRAAACRTLPVWQKLDKLMNDYLDSVSIADLTKTY